MPPQPVLPDLLAAPQAISANFRKDVAPDDPIQEPEPEHSPACDGVRPVREMDVRFAPWGRPDEGHDEEEDVRGAEEGGSANREWGGARPVGERAEVEVYDPEGDDGVDYGKRV